MTGEQFDDSKNLYYLLIGLKNFQGIFDKSYLTINHKKRMSDKDREIFQIRTLDFKNGSFVSEMGIYIATVTQLAIPYVSTLTPKDLFELVLSGFKYLKFVLTANSNGEKITIEAGDNNMLNVINGDNNTVIIIPNETIAFVKKAETNFEQMAKSIDHEKGVKSINFTDKKFPHSKAINITEHEKNLFQQKVKLEPETIKIKANFFRLDGNQYFGRLKIIRSNDYQLRENEEYNFDFINKPDADLLSNLFMQEKEVHALKETVLNTTTLEKTVKKLKIIDIA